MFKELRLTTKLLGGFLAVPMIMAAVGTVGYQAMSEVVSRS